jgi:para-nitrobenzyl esterase
MRVRMLLAAAAAAACAASATAALAGGATAATAQEEGCADVKGLADAATVARVQEEDRAAFLADVKSRAAGVEAAAAAGTLSVSPRAAASRVLAEASAAATARKGERMRAAMAEGRLGAVTAHTKYGDLVGVGGGNASVNQFLGVPFAQPPVGGLRWKAPQPPAAWGSRNATWFGLTCMQSEWYWGILTGLSEDCLYLNVYAPNKAPPAGGFPTMLFWYGGSSTYGGASFPLYDGITDIALAQDAILVTSNYRLNVFGYLAGDALKAESPDGAVGNYGLQDQRAALRFLVDTLPAFGGNPGRITIFGESAGGASVANHLVSPRSAGLFQGAMIESGTFSCWTAQPYAIAALRLPEVAANVGCAGAPDVLACMRGVNASAMLDRGDNHLTQGQLEWGPTIDGVEVVGDPRALAAAGKAAPVPILLGNNADEGTLFNDAPTDLNASDYQAAIAEKLGPAMAAALVAEYPAAAYESPWWAISAIMRDGFMMCPVRDTATWLTTPARAATPVWAYFYTHILFLIDIVDLFKPLRCFHGSELVSVFDFTLLQWGVGEADMGRGFVTYWTNFAVYGDPNGPTVPAWPAWGANATVAQLDTGAAGFNVTLVHNLLADKCAFWAAHPVNASAVWG